MAASHESANILVASPAIAAAVVMGAMAAEKAIVLSLNTYDKLKERVIYGPATDPHTWPDWQDADMENPNIERIEAEMRTPEFQAKSEEFAELMRDMYKGWPELGECPF